MMEALYNWMDAKESVLLSWEIPVIMSGLYLSGIFLLKKWQERRMASKNQLPPKGKEPTKATAAAQVQQQEHHKKSLSQDKLRLFMAAHNLFLFVLSLVMAVATFYEAFIVRLPEVGASEIFCSRDRQGVYNKGLFFWSAVFYFSKYYEYLDTVFIVLNNRPVIFLHLWHHLSIAFLTLAFLQNHLTFLFSGVLINSAIHTAMYWSYFQTCLGKDVWWKKYLTMMQMVQFAWGIGSWLPWLPVCGWDTTAFLCMLLNWAILSSFFYLFKQFYNTRYTPAKASGAVTTTTQAAKKTATN